VKSLLSSSTLGAAVSAMIVLPAFAQQFQQQTSTRFPTQSEYTNYNAVFDADGDGDLDIFFANGQGYSSQGAALQQRLYINNGAGFFADQSSTRLAGITGWCRGVDWGDVDGDGDMDLIVTQDFNKLPKLLINDGLGFFTDQAGTRLPPLTLSSMRGMFADVDNDGDLDIVLNHSGAVSRFGSGQPKIYFNNGLGVFTDMTATNLPAGNIAEQMDVIFCDVDADFDLDVFIGTRASSPNQTRLWKNNGAGVFTNQTGFPADQSSYAIDTADIDGDGDMDAISVNGGSSNQELLARNNNGLGTSWTNISSSIVPNPTTDDNDCRFLDYDNDGDLDLLVGSLGSTERIYSNNGAGAFAQAAGIIPSVSDATLAIDVADYDGDGRIDFITGQGESGAFQNRIYMNITGPIDDKAPKVLGTEQVVPASPDGAQVYIVRTRVIDSYSAHHGFHAASMELHYTVNGCDQYAPIAMKWMGNSVWRGVLPAMPNGALVEYHVEATDRAGNTGLGAVMSFTAPGTAPTLGDFNQDGQVDGDDLGTLLGFWGDAFNEGDLNCDGAVDGDDLGTLLGNWS